MKISVIVNLDSRSQRDIADTMFSGVVNNDFMTEGLYNKKKFFDGFDIELIAYVDVHESIPEDTLSYMKSICDTLVLRKHTTEPGFNDWNYIRALQCASGDIVCHWDGDMAGFAYSSESVQEVINLLDTYAYVSYPSHWSPNAVNDPAYNYKWCSTRFFMCKKETLNIPEIIKCLTSYEYFIGTYKPSRVNHWTEHFLGVIANSNVYYPPIDLKKLAIFSWSSYEKYTLKRLNELPYEEVANWIFQRGINYPCDVNC